MTKWIFFLSLFFFSNLIFSQYQIELVKDFDNSDNSNSHLDYSVEYNGKILLSSSSHLGVELFITDGTSSGTELVKDINTEYSNASSNPNSFINFNNKVYFSAEKNSKRGLWETDGTELGTILKLPDFQIDEMYVFSNELFISSINKLYKYEPTTNNLTELIVLEFEYSRAENYFELNGKLYFNTNINSDLWSYDLATGNTVLEYDFDFGINYSYDKITSIKIFNNNILIYTYHEPNGDGITSLWSYSTTNHTTTLIYDSFEANQNANLQNSVEFNNLLYIAYNNKLWELDTNFNFNLIESYNSNLIIQDLIVFNNRLFYYVTRHIFGIGDDYGSLFSSNGIHNNAILEHDLLSYDDSVTNDYVFQVIQNKLFFSSEDGYLNNCSDFLSPLYYINASQDDLNVAYEHCSSGFSSSFVVLNDKIIFMGNDFTSPENKGQQLFSYQISTNISEILKDINISSRGSYRVTNRKLKGITINNGLYFSSGEVKPLITNTGYAGINLQKIDNQGTNTIVKNFSGDCNPGLQLLHFFKFNEKFLFYAFTNDLGYELWISDGTEANTTLLKDIIPGTESSLLSQGPKFLLFENHVYFEAKGGIWKTDGTEAGTQLFIPIDFPNGDYSSLFIFNNKLTILNLSQSTDYEMVLLVYENGDFTEYNTGLIWLDTIEYWYHDPTVYNNKLFFGSNNCQSSCNQHKLYFFDENYTVNEIEIQTATTSFEADVRFTLNNKLYFFAGTIANPNNESLWETDGSQSGTQEVTQINGRASSIIYLNNKIVYQFYSPTVGSEIGFTDGTAAGTFNLDLNPGGGSANGATISNAFKLGDKLYFEGNDGINGRELFVTDGSIIGTQLVEDINKNYDNGQNTDIYGSHPIGFIQYEGYLYFTANNGINGIELMRLKDDDCFDLSNSGLDDLDLDGIKNLCDQDDDNDGIKDEDDNCSLITNSNQSDYDNDGIGDVCDDDDDNDGILDVDDDCQYYTGSISNNGCPLDLPSSNFTIETLTETCVNQNNAQIIINAQANYNYEVTLTSNGIPVSLDVNTFTNTLIINNLSAEEYILCISIPSENYTQCFNLDVSEPANLRVVSNINDENNRYSLTLTGAITYSINFNNQIFKLNSESESSQVIFEHLLNQEVNTIEVTTDKLCQDKFEEIITIENFNELKLYPNPTNGTLYLSLTSVSETGVVKISDILGNIIHNKIIQLPINNYKINTDKFNSGVYFIQLISPNNNLRKSFIKN